MVPALAERGWNDRMDHLEIVGQVRRDERFKQAIVMITDHPARTDRARCGLAHESGPSEVPKNRDKGDVEDLGKPLSDHQHAGTEMSRSTCDSHPTDRLHLIEARFLQGQLSAQSAARAGLLPRLVIFLCAMTSCFIKSAGKA